MVGGERRCHRLAALLGDHVVDPPPDRVGAIGLQPVVHEVHVEPRSPRLPHGLEEPTPLVAEPLRVRGDRLDELRPLDVLADVRVELVVPERQEMHHDHLAELPVHAPTGVRDALDGAQEEPAVATREVLQHERSLELVVPDARAAGSAVPQRPELDGLVRERHEPPGRLHPRAGGEHDALESEDEGLEELRGELPVQGPPDGPPEHLRGAGALIPGGELREGLVGLGAGRALRDDGAEHLRIDAAGPRRETRRLRDVLDALGDDRDLLLGLHGLLGLRRRRDLLRLREALRTRLGGGGGGGSGRLVHVLYLFGRDATNYRVGSTVQLLLPENIAIYGRKHSTHRGSYDSLAPTRI